MSLFSKPQTPLRLYHGSHADFQKFALQPVPHNGAFLGYGIYLTTDKKRACDYADDKYVYTAGLIPAAAKNNISISASRKNLSYDQVRMLVQKISQTQIDTDGYPYLISDWGEPESASDLTEDQDLINVVASHTLTNNHDDLSIINDLAHQLGGGPLAAEILNPILNSLGIFFVRKRTVVGDQKSSTYDYLVFDPANLQILNKEKVSEIKQTAKKEKDADQRFLEATKGTPVIKFKDAHEVAEWLNDTDEDNERGR